MEKKRRFRSNGNIVLIGFMGSGKSSVGKYLASCLNLEYISSDDIIEEREKMKISDIFKKYGEKYFREREKEVIRDVSNRKNTVIATGGGIVLNWENVENLKKNGVTFFLRTSCGTIYNRIKDDKTRPLLDVEDPISTIRRILKVRMPLYKAASDYIIDTSRLSVEEVSEKIKNYIRRIEDEKD
ncbi:TPA: shikimate kinase [bacterium]|nr:shikimate kinase [bacterium]